MPKKKKTSSSAGKSPLIIILTASLLAGLAVGYALGFKNKSISVSGLCLVGVPGELKEKLVKAGAIKEYANSLSGKILSVQGNEVSFEAALVNPLQDESLKTRTAVIMDQTKIYTLSFQSPEVRQKAIEETAPQIKNLQGELITLEVDIKSCYGGQGSVSTLSCQDINKKKQTVLEELSRLQALSGEYLRSEGKFSDIRPGLLITALAGKAEKAFIDGGQAPDGINIANEQRFEVAAIEVKELPWKKEGQKK